MAKNITHDKETREKMLAGISKLAEVVGSTLGPMGRNVVIETPYGATTVTKDGVTVAKHLDVEDAVENLGVQIIKQAAARTASLAGDGTTTATVIAASIVKEANKLIQAGVPPIDIKRRLDQLLKQSLQQLSNQSREVTQEKIGEIATISANNDSELGELIQQAYSIVGPQGLITLEESKTGATTLEYTEGVSVEKGYASPYFITDASKGEAVLENPLIFITDQKLRYMPEIVPLLEIAATSSRPLLIIADEIEGQALALCVLNKSRGVLSVAAITAPSFGESRAEQLKDIAALTSATIYSKADASRLEHIKAQDLGSASRVIVSKNKTIFVDPNRNEELVSKRAEEIRTLITGENDQYLQQKLQRRLADLTAKVAVIKVGAPTETELKEKKDRVDDALRATACALQKGYLPGGGTALAKLTQKLELSNNLIDNLYTSALSQPLMKIASNAGVPGEVVLHKVLQNPQEDFGFNALSMEYTNLVDEGVIDPTIVVEQALTNAVSAASMVILSSSSLTNADRTPPYSPGDINDYAAQ
jgi:chaperonin GroEL